ncbi:RNA polymerase sigma factor [Cyclobacterium plantarum]|uniref:RNA polymerase sigma factor n=1 Tax=Cyclobacterium plantarum TaxID=2716263 RepID=UPI003F727691
MPHPDQKYIDALLNNNQKLLDELYEKYSGKIKWMVLKNNGSEDDAADIFQEALITIYHKARRESFELTCPMDAFLYLICKKKWLNVLSKRKVSGKVTITDEDRSIPGEDSFLLAEESLLQEERMILLKNKINEIGASCREILQLSWSGKSMEEVAGLLDFSYGYARKKKSECMAKLIELVKKSDKYKTLKW